MKKLIRAGVVGLALYGAYSLYKMYDMKKSIRNITDDWDEEMGYSDDTEDSPNKDQADDWNLGTERDEDLFNVEPDYSGEFKTDFNAFTKPSDNIISGSIFDTPVTKNITSSNWGFGSELNNGVETNFDSDLDDNWDSDPDDDTTKLDSEQYPDNWDLDIEEEPDEDPIKEDLHFGDNEDYIEDEEEF